MPRKRRIHYRYAIYHVMLRGNYRQNIFHDDEDRKIFCKILERCTKKYLCSIHLFCLMTNHIHLVIEVSDIPLSKIMQNISSLYSMLHNRRYNKIGHLFQGRYKSNLIQNEAYLLELCHYIHANPIQARMCQSLDDYLWSSHLVYSKKQSLSWLTTQYIEQLLSELVNAKSNHYISFIKNRENTYKKPAYCSFDDSGELVIRDSVKLKMKNIPTLGLKNIPLRKIANVVCAELNLSMKELTSERQTQSIALARSLVTYFAHYHASYTLQDISAALGRKPDSLSKTLQRHLEKYHHCRFIKGVMETVERKLSALNPDNLVL